VPWGCDGSLELRFPARGPIGRAEVDVVKPRLDGGVSDYPAALTRALDAPLSAERLERLVSARTRVAIVVDDPSRWTPVEKALAVVLPRLHEAGVRPGDITVILGVGRHHAVGAEAMRLRLGGSVTDRYRCFSPPVDDLSAYCKVGTIPGGTPIQVFRPVAQADLRILIGSVLPHLQAGFGGGYKLVFPGACHRTTLGALHRQGLNERNGSGSLLGGDAADNPMRQAIHCAATLLGPSWSVSHVIGGPDQIFQIAAGDPKDVQDVLAVEVKRRFLAPSAVPADLAIVGNFPWPGDPMQSFKVLLHHQAACRPGGVLIGIFWTDEREIDRSFPMATLRAIAATGCFGGWAIRQCLPAFRQTAAMMRSPATFMLHWACKLVVDRTVLVYAPVLRQEVGPQLGPVRLFDTQDALWQAALTALERWRRPADTLQVRIFPEGGLTYAL
jgi:lactate racemase